MHDPDMPVAIIDRDARDLAEHDLHPVFFRQRLGPRGIDFEDRLGVRVKAGERQCYDERSHGASFGPGCYLLAGRLGAARSSVEPSLACPVAPPLGVCMDEPPAAEDLPPSVLWQPESARANEPMRMSASFMSHEKQAARPL